MKGIVHFIKSVVNISKIVTFYIKTGISWSAGTENPENLCLVLTTRNTGLYLLTKAHIS